MDHRDRLPTIALGALIVVAGLVLIPVVAAEWRVCTLAPRFDSLDCLNRQTDHDYGPVAAVWLGALALMIAGLLLSRARGGRPRVFAVALVAVLVGNILADYTLTPLVNGGYVSHDSPPGMGYWAAGSLVCAGAVLIVGGAVPRRLVVRATPPLRVTAPR